MKKLLLVCFVLALTNTAYAFEVAIRWTTPNPGSEYEIGDVVMALEDNADWGTSIDPRINPASNFRLIQVTGVPAESATQYFQELYTYEHPNWKKRQFKFDDLKVPANILNTLDRDGIIYATIEQWNTFITNKEGLL